MRKIVKEINIFNFEELKEDYKLYNFNMGYSLSYCQGDGFCFYNDRYNLLSYTILNNKDVKNANVFEKYLIENNLINDKLLNYLCDGYNLGIFRRDNYYSHAKTCFINYEYYYNDDEQETTNKYVDMICDKLYTLYINIREDMEGIGYSCYNVSDDEVKEYIADNDYEFLEDGDIFQE